MERYPVRMIESGPAAGALMAAAYGELTGHRDLIAFDMGGTTAKLALIEGGRPFTTSYTTRFPEYISVRSPIPQEWIYAALRSFHGAAAVTMVATPSLMSELRARGFTNLGMWTRGVDVDLFRPDRAIDLGFARPIFMTVGRVAIEKNLEAFLSLDLPGTKVVIGAGPHEAILKRSFPQAKFLGPLDNGILAAHLAAADVFVFPSRTDTFGIVQLEALASGVPIAAFPVTGPKDVVGERPIGVLHEDLGHACMDALKISRDACRKFALDCSWENSARQFLGHVRKVAAGGSREVAGVGRTGIEDLSGHSEEISPLPVDSAPSVLSVPFPVCGLRRTLNCLTGWRAN
jgi:glycosyltransferase involved in cell wall biosynthesis